MTRKTLSTGEATRTIGERMPDGTIYAGVSPTTKKDFYVVPEDAPLTMNWKRAQEFASQYCGEGHSAGEYRLPSEKELQQLFKNSEAIGHFKHGLAGAAWYWSATPFPHQNKVCVRRAADNAYDHAGRKEKCISVRLVLD